MQTVELKRADSSTVRPHTRHPLSHLHPLKVGWLLWATHRRTAPSRHECARVCAVITVSRSLSGIWVRGSWHWTVASGHSANVCVCGWWVVVWREVN